MPTVEEAYHQAWGKAGGAGRLRRSFSLHTEIRRMIEHQIRSKQPGLSERDVAIQVARRMYMSDGAAQRQYGADRRVEPARIRQHQFFYFRGRHADILRHSRPRLK